ncbi:MAG: class I SAM-dependent methyltransferase [Spirochaetales bacterium]|nr:class I SAM-dependent methyltransferase [Spirochaetales bacterium]
MADLSHSERHARLFERISIPYAWFFAGQTRSYADCFALGRSALPTPQGKKALDIGCGTGAFTTALRAEGWEVEGVDVAQGMIAQAKRRGVPCSVGNILGGLEHADASFDLVSAAYVAHGLRRTDRLSLFREARRLSRGVVLFHDYTPDRRLLTSIIEYAEGGDYFNFIKTGEEEMRSAFSSVRVIRVGAQAAWYVCQP